MSVARIKYQFESWNKNKRISSWDAFYYSNDQFPLTFLPPVTEKQETKNWITWLVGPADIFSIIDRLSNHIILCDYNVNTLNFVNKEKNFLLNLYQKYNEKQINFDQVADTYYKTDLIPGSHRLARKRKYFLGEDFFLYSEEKYKKKMQALQDKNLVTLDIDLFNREEQKKICQLIQEEKMTVHIMNMTNLPDYDDNGNLIKLMEQIPFTPDPYIVWNIHDQGPIAFDINKIHDFLMEYLFVVRSPSKFTEHFISRPIFFAQIDRAFCVLSSYRMPDEYLLKRYQGDNRYEKKDPEKRGKYLAALKEKTMYMEDICRINGVFYPPRGRLNEDYVEILDTELKIISEPCALDLVPMLHPGYHKINDIFKENKKNLAEKSFMQFELGYYFIAIRKLKFLFLFTGQLSQQIRKIQRNLGFLKNDFEKKQVIELFNQYIKEELTQPFTSEKISTHHFLGKINAKLTEDGSLFKFFSSTQISSKPSLDNSSIDRNNIFHSIFKN